MIKINRFNAAALVWGILMVSLGLAFIWIGGQISHLACTRLESGRVDCQLQDHFLGLIPVQQQLLRQITGSELKEDCFDGCRYWIELQSEAGPVSLTRFSSYYRPGVLADQIQIEIFLSNPKLRSFEHRGSPSLILFGCSLPFFAVGGFLVVWYSRRLFEA